VPAEGPEVRDAKWSCEAINDVWFRNFAEDLYDNSPVCINKVCQLQSVRTTMSVTTNVLYVYCLPTGNPFKTSLQVLPGEPFYVGIGSAKRKFDHLKFAILGKSSPTNKKLDLIRELINCNTEPVILELRSGLSVSEAKALEKSLIAEIGTIDIVKGVLNRGPLYNLHSGGGGGVGSKKPRSEETKLKMSKAKTGHKNTEEHNASISKGLRLAFKAPGMHEKLSAAQRSKLWTPEHSKAASDRMKNRIVSEATRKKLSIVNTGKHHTEESKIKMSIKLKAVMSSEEVLEKLRSASAIRWQRPEELAKIAKRSSKTYSLTHNITGETFVISNMQLYCRTNKTYPRKVEKEYTVKIIS
jgi:hypothetical protein